MLQPRHLIAAPLVALLAFVVGKVLGGVVGFMFFVFGGGAYLIFWDIFAGAFDVFRTRIKGPANLEDKSPEQQLRVLSKRMGLKAEQTSLPTSDELGIRVRGIECRAESNVDAALADAQRLVGAFPRAPAAHAVLARVHRLAGSPVEEGAAGTNAIRVALEGGMNAVAARSFVELSPESHEHMQLAAPDLERLARALDANGEAEAAHWCRESGLLPADSLVQEEGADPRT